MPFLAADVGGTFARVALVRAAHDDGREVEVLAYRKLACAAFPGLAELLQSFIDDEVRTTVRHCVLACAGYLKGDEVLSDNSAWPIHLGRLRQALGIDDIAVLNDLEALGYGIDDRSDSGARSLVSSEPQATWISRLPSASIRPQPVRRSPGSMPRMRIGWLRMALLIPAPPRPASALASLGLVEGAPCAIERPGIAQHLEPHCPGKRRDFHQPDLDGVGKAIALAAALPGKRVGSLIEDIVVVAER